MPNWKKKIDDHKNRLFQETQRKQEELLLEKAKKTALFEEQRNRALAQFRCHVCNSTAKSFEMKATFPPNADFQGTKETNPEDWDWPRDFIKCDMCNKWTCEKCRYQGICKTCAEKL